MSKRNPYSGDAGYRAVLKTEFGHVVLYDRQNGGDWIDAETRWVVIAFDASGANVAILDATSERHARGIMRDTAAGWVEWIELAHPVTVIVAVPAEVHAAALNDAYEQVSQHVVTVKPDDGHGMALLGFAPTLIEHGADGAEDKLHAVAAKWRREARKRQHTRQIRDTVRREDAAERPSVVWSR